MSLLLTLKNKNMTETTKKEIEKLTNDFSDTVYKKISTAEETYFVNDDVENLLYKIGIVINNDILIDMFKKPKTIEEIVSEIENGGFIADFEELEVIESGRDANGFPKYSFLCEIVKHIPTGRFYRFLTQIYRGNYSKAEFDGEVIQKEITTTQWVKK
jgi:hypothetical protein